MKQLKHIESINLPPLKGGELIAEATDLFTGWIDSDFRNWKADEKGNPTESMKVDVMEMTEDATFAEMMSPDNILTQDQIIYFVENFKNLLCKDYYTFFPFKSNGETFVADVDFSTDGCLEAGVCRFSYDGVWRAGDRDRIVVPQLAPRDLQTPLTPSSLDTSDVKAKLKDFITSLETLYKIL